MDGDPRNRGVSLLKKYDIPIEHLSYDYAEKCSNKKELERMIRILRSGEEGSYPHLLKFIEKRLRLLAPDSRVLRVETPVLTKECLTKEEWDVVENELLCWEEEMNIMDKSLDFEKSRIEIVGDRNLPQVRKVVQKNGSKNNSLFMKAEILQKAQDNSKLEEDNNRNRNNNNVTKTNNRRIKSGDYDAWDKYDVDKELLKMDVEEERQQELNEKRKRETKKLEKEKKIEIAEINKENYSSMEQQVLANQAKDRGNECYKSGDLGNALKYYEISIKFYPTANAYNNRAMTYLKLKNYDKALEDCNKVLHLEKNNIKALHRRATAYQNMQNEKENLNYSKLALQDLYQIVHLEPNNKLVQAEIQKLKKKLNIEDSGRKFRLPISEELVNSVNSNQIEEKNSHHIKDNNLATDKLPLTYYGPSTSAFQCEPYSMVHRALSGTSIPGRVLCKCNSNIPRQNPLCQKCGEAMCTPKPTKAIKTENKVKFRRENNKEILKNNTNVSDCMLPVENEIGSTVHNSDVIKAQSELSEEKSADFEIKECNDDDVNKLGKNNSVSQIESKEALDVTESDLTSTEVDNSDKENCNCEINSEKIEEAAAELKLLSVSDEIKNTEVVCNRNNETITATNSSSLNDSNSNVKKSKNKKKKSKEVKEVKPLRKHLETVKMEPVRVVYASKYLQPTSVEPKVKNKTPANLQLESTLTSNTQYETFLPNRKCYSTEFKTTEDSVTTSVPPTLKEACSYPSDKGYNYLFSGESKENILESNYNMNVESEEKKDGSEDVKTEIIDSAFEFTKAWEEAKKLDESYVKRAEIICKIKPEDLSKVIGIKLDADMLSSILECLLKQLVETEPRKVIELLKQLPQIPRFQLVSMFLADTDKKKMKMLIQVAEDKGFKLDEDVKKNLIALR